jgi:hypothetical protein|tara:strand:- start:312 stop:929 length:618 start_codon:yes stop_codon:yes gene_type:complete
MLTEKASVEDNDSYIIQPTILMDILNDEMEKMCMDKKSKKEFSGYRTQLKKSEWKLKGMLNHVDDTIYRDQINKTIEGMLKHIKLVQPNGDWAVMEYETDIRKNVQGDDSIMLAVSFVDVRNEKDLKYRNGVPVVDVNVDVTGSNKELIEAIKSQSDNSNDGELKDLLKQFISMMAKKEMQEQQSSIKTKKVEEKFDGDPEGFSE